MTIQNTIDFDTGSNSNHIFTAQIADTIDHDFPDVNGDDSEGGDGFDIEGTDTLLVKVVNNQDQDATARLEGTTGDDSSFSESDIDIDNITVVAGSVETFSTTHNWDLVRVVVSFSTAPSGSNSTKVVYRTPTR